MVYLKFKPGAIPELTVTAVLHWFLPLIPLIVLISISELVYPKENS